MIKLEKVTRSYRKGFEERVILKSINLEIGRNSFNAIMGPSGSGKSTLTNIIGCLDTPTIGNYMLDGQEINQFSEKKPAKYRNQAIGFIFQQLHLPPGLTAKKNVELPMIYAGMKKKERVGLSDYMTYLPNSLSRGQKQRVAIARAMANNPSIILADEPTESLDTKTSRGIMNLLSDLHGEGDTIVMVTHNPEIAAYSERTIIIRDGVVVEKDPVFAERSR